MRKPTLLETLLEQARPEMLIGAASLLVVLVASAGYLYAIKPPLSEYRVLVEKHEGAELARDLEPPDPDPNLIPDLESKVAQVRNRLYGGSSQVSMREMESYVLDALDRIAANHGTELERVTPGSPDTVLMFDELPYDVEIRGSYHGVFAWLWDAESELGPMVVKRFSMDPVSDTDSVRMRLRLVAYRAKGTGT